MLTRDFEELLKVGVALSSEHDIDKLLDLILSEAQRLTKADGGSIYFVEKDKLIFQTVRSNTYFKKWGEDETHQIFKSFEMPITKDSVAGYVALTLKPLNISDVRKIPPESEYHYNPSTDRKYGYETISMLVIPMLDYEEKIIGVLQLINSKEGGEAVPFTEEHLRITSSLASQAAVAIQNAKFAEELRNAHYDTIIRLSTAAEYRDKETANHIKRVSHYSRLIVVKLGLPKKEVELIFWAAPMHDIGKLGIPDAVLLKPGKLDPEERKIMEQHSVIGAKILEGSEADIIVKSRIIALTHHEKYDGTGYPQKLKGEDIPLEGRIVAIADVYDALSSKRPYKDPFPEEKVLAIMKESRGNHFDPRLLDLFLASIDEARQIKKDYPDTEEINWELGSEISNVSQKS